MLGSSIVNATSDDARLDGSLLDSTTPGDEGGLVYVRTAIGTGQHRGAGIIKSELRMYVLRADATVRAYSLQLDSVLMHKAAVAPDVCCGS